MAGQNVSLVWLCPFFGLGSSTFQDIITKLGTRDLKVGAANFVTIWMAGAIVNQDGGPNHDLDVNFLA